VDVENTEEMGLIGSLADELTSVEETYDGVKLVMHGFDRFTEHKRLQSVSECKSICRHFAITITLTTLLS
jgi:hypothetical protein